MSLSELTREQANKLYRTVMQDHDIETMRHLCREDLFFLLAVVCKRKDMQHDWVYARCREIEVAPDGYLDLWARGHYKSTIITFGRTIQDILLNPEITVGIFSHTASVAEAFLLQIKREFESNDLLKELFPDILYASPQKESVKWSTEGIIVKRKSNPKEATVEAWGLVDGQPIGRHFGLCVYDDVVVPESVATPNQIEKTTNFWSLSLNLVTTNPIRRYVGTRYHFNDTYKTILERHAAIPRLHPATSDGTIEGEPVFMTAAQLAEKREQMGPYIYSCQMLQNPVADGSQGFKEDWLNYYDNKPTMNLNLYLLVDPAGEKKKSNDYTVMWVVALAPDGNYYVIDGVRDRMNLTERTKKVFDFVRKYKPLTVGYEKYGLQSDIEHIRYVQEQMNWRFNIIPLGGATPKNDRIRKLIPVFETARIWMPRRLLFINAEGNTVDMMVEFLKDEYTAFPVSIHDDMLDCLARILDPALFAVFPKEQAQNRQQPIFANNTYDPLA